MGWNLKSADAEDISEAIRSEHISHKRQQKSNICLPPSSALRLINVYIGLWDVQMEGAYKSCYDDDDPWDSFKISYQIS